MEIKELLDLTVKNNASDLHLLPDVPPALRIDGELMFLTNMSVLTGQDIEKMVFSITTPEQKDVLLANKELDFSIAYGGGTSGELGRFRVNAYYQKGSLAAAFRYLPRSIRSIEQLHMPKILHSFTQLRQGLVLVCGPTGQGKSTTLAAMVNEVNMERASHILTIEDPIEYVYPQGKSIISQREMKIDTHSWTMALRSALREDPDVVLVGEMRDAETMASAMTIAETGHLVFSTLHTNSASQSIDRIIDSFPEHQQSQIRIQLAFVLKGIVSQRLIPQIGGGRIPAIEVLVGTPATSSNIRDGKTHLIDSVIQTSQDVGMITMESSLSQLVLSGTITLEMARSYALHPDEFMRLLG
ncbi:MAG: type IV pilus twitching motility protein PilT [Patescibacteria group bacterium]|nr:type IV pilus twitching motility protein PilT [Patescibacteria group bacterium]MDE2590481.1 type IV pilus twitching motility protein PilT [Patescibacteria group bacterium]